ncbi:MAG: hypothetical protein NC543_07935 [bacterium]|nr:hypothetical protein [bacterium]MCM1373508.1 hypothetical protein [Muribaculum sp.]
MRTKKKQRKKRSLYWVMLGLYTAALLVLCWSFLIYTDKSLMQYEASQPGKKMEDYIAELRQMASEGSLTQHISMPKPQNAFETAEMYGDLYAAQLDGTEDYTYEKDPESYLAEEPVYTVAADSVPVARVTLSASDAHVIFGILTIMDWDIREVSPILTQKPRDYTLCIPDCYQVSVNGILLGSESLTGKETPYPAFANVSPYVKMPVLVEYQVSGLLAEPSIEILDAAGQAVAFSPDEQGNIYVDYHKEKQQMPEEYEREALKMAQTWENFMTRDLAGPLNGLDTIQKYLIRDSYYWDIAESYARGVDITFISSHTLPASPYSDIAVTDYIPYGEDCYSCHIYFKKTMLLNSGSRRTNTIDSTFYFVYYDDSDDGVDNPHWAIADMLATTD